MKKKIFFYRIIGFYERDRFFRLTDRVKDFFLHFLARRDWQLQGLGTTLRRTITRSSTQQPMKTAGYEDTANRFSAAGGKDALFCPLVSLF